MKPTALTLFLSTAMLFLPAACVPSGPAPGDRAEAATIPESADPSKPGTYTGHSLDEAERFAEKHGVAWRVVERDGESLPATMDYRPERLNFTIRGRIVTEVRKG